MKIPKLVYNLKDNIIFCLSLPLFVLAFAILYTPTFGNGTLIDWPHYEYSSMCIAIMAAIIMCEKIFFIVLWVLWVNILSRVQR